MRVTSIVQGWRNDWKRAANAGVTLVVLSAVAVGAVSLLGPEVFAAWKAPGDAERRLVSGNLAEGLLNFEAPAKDTAWFQTATAEANESIRRASNAAAQVNNWKYTQSPTNLGSSSGVIGASLSLYIQAIEAELYLSAFNNYITQLENAFAGSPFSSTLNSLLMSYSNQVNLLLANYVNLLASIQSSLNSLIPAAFRPPPIPPASPCMCMNMS